MNYPPGVTAGMVPGWRKQDAEDDAENARLSALAEEAWPALAETIRLSGDVSRMVTSSALDVCDDEADVPSVADRLSDRLRRDLE